MAITYNRVQNLLEDNEKTKKLLNVLGISVEAENISEQNFISLLKENGFHEVDGSNYPNYPQQPS